MTKFRGFDLSARLAVVAGVAALASAGTVLTLGSGPWPALAAGLVTAAVGVALGQALLVRPLRQVLDGLAALDPGTTSLSPSEATRAITAVAERLRLAEWRQARLGALAAGAARVSHDLRGTLSPALLGAERLQLHAEPGIKRIGDIIVRGVERAIELVRSSVEFAREGHQAIPATRFSLQEAVAEAVASARAAMPGVAIEVTQDAAAEISADRENVVRSLSYLLRYCGAPPTATIRLAVRVTLSGVALDFAGDRPFPAADLAALSPFGDAAGLLLAIARDLARSNGGSVAMERDAPGGPVLRLALPATVARPTASQPVA